MISETVFIVRHSKAKLAGSTGLMVLSSLCGVIPFGLTYTILLQLLSKEPIPKQTIWLCFSGMLAALFAQILLTYYSNKVSWGICGDVGAALKMKLGDHLRKLPMGFYTNRQLGDLSTTLVRDFHDGVEHAMFFVPIVLAAMLTPLVVAIALSWLSWRMTVAMLFSVGLAAPLILVSLRVLDRLHHKLKAAEVESASRLIEYAQGMSVIKAFHQRGRRYERLDGSLTRLRDASIAAAVKTAPTFLSALAVLEIGFTFILMSGIYLLLGGEITMAVFLLFLLVSLRLYASLMLVANYLVLLKMMATSARRIKALLDERPLAEPARDVPLPNYDIEFRDVTFRYEDQVVLDEVSFTIPERTMTALVGPSGSGKTTVANLIPRFWDVQRGEVRIGGKNIRDYKTDTLLSDISMVFQEVYLFNDTVSGNIRFGKPNATIEEVIAAARLAQCHDFIEMLPDGYNTMIGEGGSTLSGGEKQRISIARAILKNAPIIILDEATASVDPENEAQIQAAINALVAEKTVIIIAHRLSTVTAADQILALDKGKLAERGRHHELLAANGLYARLWQERQQARGWRLKEPKDGIALLSIE